MIKRLARRLGASLVVWSGPVPTDPVDAAVEQACLSAGVSVEGYGPDLSLARTGKIPEVLYHACRELGAKHALQTVGAITNALRGRV